MGRTEMEDCIERLTELADFLKTVARKCENCSVMVAELVDKLNNSRPSQASTVGKLEILMQQLSEQLARLEAERKACAEPKPIVSVLAAEPFPGSGTESSLEPSPGLESQEDGDEGAPVGDGETGSQQQQIRDNDLLVAAITQDARYKPERDQFLEDYDKSSVVVPNSRKIAIINDDQERLTNITTLEQWREFPGRENIRLVDVTSGFKYSARELKYRDREGNLSFYLVLPIKDTALNRGTIIKNAYIAFFDFDVDRVPSGRNTKYEVKEPAIFKKEGVIYQLVKRGKIEISF